MRLIKCLDTLYKNIFESPSSKGQFLFTTRWALVNPKYAEKVKVGSFRAFVMQILSRGWSIVPYSRRVLAREKPSSKSSESLLRDASPRKFTRIRKALSQGIALPWRDRETEESHPIEAFSAEQKRPTFICIVTYWPDKNENVPLDAVHFTWRNDKIPARTKIIFHCPPSFRLWAAFVFHFYFASLLLSCPLRTLLSIIFA